MMNKKQYLTFSGSLFAVVSLLHLLRVLYGWPAVIADWVVPMWLSWAVVIVVGFLAWKAYKLNK